MSKTGIVFRILLVVVAVEMLVMLALNALGRSTSVGTAVLDVALLAALSAPLIYLLVRGLSRRIEDQEIDRLEDRATAAKAQGRVERALRMFELGIERSGEVVFLTDPDGNIIYVNPAFEQIYGYTRHEAIGNTPRIIKSGRLPREAYRYFWSKLLAKEVVSGELINKTKDGRLITVESSANPVLDAGGTIIGFLAIQRDVTRREAMEKALRGSELRLRTLMEKIPDGVGVLSQDGHIIYANPAVTKMLGYSSEDLQGKPVWDFQHPEDRERATQRTKELFRDSAEFPSEYRLIRADGTAFPVEISSRVIEYDGQPALLATMRDLTERRQLEDQLRQSQKMEAVGQLAGGIAHDFNNLLTVIQTSSELIADSLPARVPELATDVEEVRAAVTRGKNLIEKLLQFSRRGDLAFKTLDIGMLVREFEPTLRRLLPEDIEIRLEVADNNPPVNGNSGSVEQILMNLATNGSHAMPSGGVLTIAVTLERLTMDDTKRGSAVTAGSFVCLSVKDSGSGMDARTREKLFEPFFTTRSLGGGTGLGTAVVYGLVQQHGGLIRVDSETGVGTTVRVYLPVATESEMAVEPSPEPEQRPEVYGGTETVLVAEDEPALRRAAKRSLERLGYTVLLAADGEEALELFRRKRDLVDLVMTDIVMPKMGGRALYDAVRSEQAGTKFLFASGYTAGDIQERALLDPDFPFLAKPWTIDELGQKVREVLDS